jgi:phage recombination protein Bet
MTMSDKAKTTAVQKPGDHGDEKSVEFVPFGANTAIRLSAAMVRNFIAVPTRSGALPNERDCVRFIMLCRGKRANPFEGDCFLIGYDSQSGPSFSLVCGIDLFLKRAEQSADYDGCESGVIVKTEGGIEERQGSLVLEGETIVGGWARVYRKNHTKPEYKSVKFATYNTGRSRWEKDPGGMIEKVAKSQALRAAYPTALGGLYTQEEMERVTQAGEGNFVAREPVAMPKLIETQAASEPKDAPQGPTASEPAAAQSIDADIRALYDKLPASKVNKALKAAGVKIDEGEDWEAATADVKTALLSLLKAAG